MENGSCITMAAHLEWEEGRYQIYDVTHLYLDIKNFKRSTKSSLWTQARKKSKACTRNLLTLCFPQAISPSFPTLFLLHHHCKDNAIVNEIRLPYAHLLLWQSVKVHCEERSWFASLLLHASAAHKKRRRENPLGCNKTGSNVARKKYYYMKLLMKGKLIFLPIKLNCLQTEQVGMQSLRISNWYQSGKMFPS